MRRYIVFNLRMLMSTEDEWRQQIPKGASDEKAVAFYCSTVRFFGNGNRTGRSEI